MNRESEIENRRTEPFERPHHRLDVWTKAMALAEEVYKLTRKFPPEEKFGLAQQMRRAVVSVVSNLAEGSARRSRKEFEQFLFISQGSLSELEAQFELSQRLGFLQEWPKGLANDVARMLSGLVRYAKTTVGNRGPVGARSGR